MSKQFFTMAAIYIGLSFSSCAKINGEGPVVTETRSVSGFSSIHSAMSGDVYVRQDSIFKVEVRAQKNIADVLNTTISGGELKIDYDYNKRISTTTRVEIYISCPDISKLSVTGSGSITLENNCSPANLNLVVTGSGSISIPQIHTNNISAQISGSGSIAILSGNATSIGTEIAGSGDIDFAGAQALTADVQVAGSGNTKINAIRQLSVHIAGSGDVYYRGNPQINSNISGSGRLRVLP